MNKFKRSWSHLRASYWCVPLLILAVSNVLAVALIGVDFTGGKQWLARWPRLFGAGAAGARDVVHDFRLNVGELPKPDNSDLAPPKGCRSELDQRSRVREHRVYEILAHDVELSADGTVQGIR